jgi:N-acetylmuramoyl-L-alanine amidase
VPAPRIIALALLCALLCAAWTALPAAHAQDAESSYKQAAARFLQTRNTPGAAPQSWRAVAAEFQRVHDLAPRQARGADALFSVGLALREAFRAGGTPDDLGGAQAAFERFAAEFPRHPLADDSLMHVAEMLEQDRRDAAAAAAAYRKVAEAYPDGDLRDLAQQRLKALRVQTPATSIPAKSRPEAKPAPESPRPAPAPNKKSPTESVILKRMQVLSALQFTRIILTTSGPVTFRHDMATDGKGNAVTVVLDGVKAGNELELPSSTKDGLVKQVSVSESGGSGVALTFAALPLRAHDVKEFNLPTETKLVVDLYPRPTVASAPPRNPAKRIARGPAAPIPAGQLQASLRTSLGLKVKSIMLDPGHGGHDPGAIADGLEEKSVALAIARELREILLKQHPELRVGMTRDGDAFIPLTRRPELAKAFGADLFVSIHLNANPVSRFQGVETYFLNLSSDASAIAVAARENATSEKRVSDLNGILLDLLRDTNILESSKLAAALHTSLVEQLRDTRPVRDLGVKQAPFMVLIGAEMPGVLVEAGFLTNPEEASLLKQPTYLRSIAEGIYSGLEKYIEDQDIARSRSASAADRLVSQRTSP